MHMAKRNGIHPLVAAATLLPVAIGMSGHLPTQSPSTQARHKGGGGNAPIVISCTLPFDGIKQTHSIDSSCQAPGTASSGPQAAQNEAKNNFCATGGPVNLNFSNFAQLQQAAESANIPFGGSLPPNRLALHNLLSLSNQGSVGEGSVVRVAAFVMDAHYSNVSNGESVNCQHPGNENNDIHIVLGESAVPSGQKLTEAQECASVTAEISPHFRPDVWNPGNLNGHNAHLFRFTGQLFFDAAHRPCVGGTGANPKRIAIWEVHPVYAVDICADSANNCTTGSDQNWVPLSEFVGTGAPSNETRLWLPDEISREFGAGAKPRRQGP
jgi:hypothetical protein